MPKVFKKAAICFSWQVRTLDRCLPYIRANIFDQIWEINKDYDIFCCMEDDEDAYKATQLLHPVAEKKIRSKDVEKIIDQKYWLILKLNYKHFYYPWSMSFNLRTFLQQFYKYKLCNELKNSYALEHNIEYEYVIRIRFDCLFIDKLNLSKVVWQDCIYVAEDSLRGENEVNDMFAISSSRSMDIYTSLFDEFEKILWLFPIKPNLIERFILKLERLYVYIYSKIVCVLNRSKYLKGFGSFLFQFFCALQWRILSDFKAKNVVYPERMLFKILEKNSIHIEKIKINFFLTRKDKWLNILISGD